MLTFRAWALFEIYSFLGTLCSIMSLSFLLQVLDFGSGYAVLIFDSSLGMVDVIFLLQRWYLMLVHRT